MAAQLRRDASRRNLAHMRQNAAIQPHPILGTSMQSPCERIAAAFGTPCFPDRLFYRFKYALRFELGGEVDLPVPRLLRSLDRAREVSRQLFAEAGSLSAVYSHFGVRSPSTRETKGLRDLRKLGFRPAFGRPDSRPENDNDHIAEFGEDLYRHWYCADLDAPEEQTDLLLWAAITAEMPIEPSMRAGSIYLVDFARRAALWVYDDRGMDVIAADPALLVPLYRTYDSWLLDHDRERMDATFQPLSPQAPVG